MVFKCYPISDVWLDTTDENAPDFIDIAEIRNDPTGNQPLPENSIEVAPDYENSSYLTWVMANDPSVFTRLDGTNPSKLEHINKTQFKDFGIRVGNTDGGHIIRGVMMDDAMIVSNEFYGRITHDECFRRIYRNGTTARKIWFLGY